MNNENNIQMLSDTEAYNVCLNISSQLIALTSNNLKVQDKFNLYKIIKSELEFLSAHYKGSALNDLLTNIITQFNKVENETLKNLNDYKNLYSDPSKPGQDGYC